ncbi:MAG: isopentenyl-diphosphate delta-isomerase [Alphaproteobacteria bacterium CG_4_10_14_0_2_um_filter_63_37]|nr:MAG: isopentenyl-diphosphate delta-isomerase [Proteobacteria bacterium CG1_02_64_396]PJA26065.1 MAG: isopentenyl-diphosphate delta-isomerase [Alphaproteobacteria bacterium CG_4_10_14_0_2_um_filter_63_37]
MKGIVERCRRLDGQSFGAYKSLKGRHDLLGWPDASLLIDHIQADPFAPPSRLRVLIPWGATGIPDHARRNAERQRAARDFIARAFARAAHGCRDLHIDAGGQTVLERSACLFDEVGIELRLTAHLPAAGRRILGHKAAVLLGQTLPETLAAMLGENIDAEGLQSHCDAVEDQAALRSQLGAHGLVAFLAEGSVLPRRSGVDDRPAVNALPLHIPESLKVTLTAPHAGVVVGMGIPKGVTLIVGGGFHGKSTLLAAIAQGVYDHIPGDGRQLVVSDPTALKVRAEDGRAVTGVDLSPFIGALPFGSDTRRFTTDLASGSTSQAAAIVEGLAAGASVLLVDEDTSATNFMIRDERMQTLVAKAGEPITPLIDRIAQLRNEAGVDVVLAMGGSGDYFEVADTVIRMNAGVPEEVTDQAWQAAATHPSRRLPEGGGPLPMFVSVPLDPRRLNAETKPGRIKIQAKGCEGLVLGRSDIDLRAVEQIADSSQVRGIGQILARLGQGGTVIENPVAAVAQVLAQGVAGLSERPDGDVAMPRLLEVMAALARVRG